MMPMIRSLQELMIITEYKDINKRSNNGLIKSSSFDSCQRKRYLRSINDPRIELPDLSKKTKLKWKSSKEAISKFLNELDYNNQIQSSYDLTLIDMQHKNFHRDVA